MSGNEKTFENWVIEQKKKIETLKEAGFNEVQAIEMLKLGAILDIRNHMRKHIIR